MEISNYSFHDATINLIVEKPNQILEFHIDFYTDWKNHKHEKRILRFTDVTNHSSVSGPFSGEQTILEVKELPDNTVTMGSFSSKTTWTRRVVQLITNEEERTIEYLDCDLVLPRPAWRF
jgi:hypothetical protein